MRILEYPIREFPDAWYESADFNTAYMWLHRLFHRNRQLCEEYVHDENLDNLYFEADHPVEFQLIGYINTTLDQSGAVLSGNMTRQQALEYLQAQVQIAASSPPA